MRSSVACRSLASLGQLLSSFAPANQELLSVTAAGLLASKLGIRAVSAACINTVASSSRQLSNDAAGTSGSWEQLKRDGVPVNPCHSPHHPAALQGVAEPAGEELSVQEAYNPESSCFGCGPLHPDGLGLRSRRMPGGGLGRLEARISFDQKYCAFPGIVNGGVLTTAMDCHGNWAAAIALMDKGCLPRPPLTLTASMQVHFREPTPPDTELVLRSRVLSIRENISGGPMKAAVEVEVTLVMPESSSLGSEVVERVMATGVGTYKRMGALRSM